MLRRWMRGDLSDEAAVREALDVVRQFRSAHRIPLTKANMGLRSVVRTEGCPAEVSQRLKRVPTVLDKLRREPTMALANMQDVGGCRAVVDTIDEVRRTQRRMAKNRPPVRTSDYIASPRASGYRGVHLVVIYDKRSIEVQLRTRVMHEWAITVERLSGRLGSDLKSGAGPAQVLSLLQAISDAMAIEEAGGVVGPEQLAQIGSLRRAALAFLPGTSS